MKIKEKRMNVCINKILNKTERETTTTKRMCMHAHYIKEITTKTKNTQTHTYRELHPTRSIVA